MCSKRFPLQRANIRAVCAPVRNYRCTVPPKHSLEKGMGMTPGYNHRWRLRNKAFLLDPVWSRRQLKAPRLAWLPHIQAAVYYYCFFFFFFYFDTILNKYFWREWGVSRENRSSVSISLSPLFASSFFKLLCCACPLGGTSEFYFVSNLGMLVVLKQKRTFGSSIGE